MVISICPEALIYARRDTPHHHHDLFHARHPRRQRPVISSPTGSYCLLIDGTCWGDDELIQLGLAAKTSRAMGHLPLDGPDGSLALLPPLGVRRTIFVHMNNTNPILLADTPERHIVEDRGMEVAMDGLEVQV